MSNLISYINKIIKKICKIFIKRDAWKYENLDPWLRSVTKWSDQLTQLSTGPSKSIQLPISQNATFSAHKIRILEFCIYSIRYKTEHLFIYFGASSMPPPCVQYSNIHLLTVVNTIFCLEWEGNSWTHSIGLMTTSGDHIFFVAHS